MDLQEDQASIASLIGLAPALRVRTRSPFVSKVAETICRQMGRRSYRFAFESGPDHRMKSRNNRS
jgi:hypothetical protein